MYVLMFVALTLCWKRAFFQNKVQLLHVLDGIQQKKHPNLYGFGMEVFQGPATTSWYGSFLKNKLAF